jgi:dephospho-CoA kinase
MDMITAQMPAELKRARADHIIENTGTVHALAAKVGDVWAALERDSEARETAGVS